MVPIFLLPTVVILHVFEAPLVIFIYIFSVIPILVPRDFSSVVFFSSIILREDRVLRFYSLVGSKEIPVGVYCTFDRQSAVVVCY